MDNQLNVQHKILQQNGYSVHYYTSGESGKELIVFLHAAFTDHRCFDRQIDYFSKKYRVITIDLLGHGLSQVGKAKDKIDSSIHHIQQIMDLEGFQVAHLVGVSMGSLIAQYFALHFPQQVSSLTILGGYDISADNKEIAKAQRSENLKWIFKALFSMNSFRRYVAKVSVTGAEEQEWFFGMASLFTLKSFSAMSGLSNVIKKRDKARREYPLLILSGEKDIELSKRSSQKWFETEPESSYNVIKDAGHCANMDRADEFNKILGEFIQSHK